ncbi:hypothetical protein Tcan_08283 [Toxocara canis]|uniref:Uncharacterized protein n=1 Tax=Toxocara canis TaxID=6265 RepID=A0A0B2VQG4_TOXCA|nr:hypothetical protein Tcan_08283 [Toxocara canis]
MTILPNKPKKSVPKGERHSAIQSANRSPAGPHLHHHGSCACISAVADTRKANCAPPAPTKSTSSSSQISRGNVPKGGTHSSGTASAECSKKQNLRRDGGSGHNSDDEYGAGFKDDNVRFA